MILAGWARFALVALFVAGLVCVVWPCGEHPQRPAFGKVGVLVWAAATLALSVIVLFIV